MPLGQGGRLLGTEGMKHGKGPGLLHRSSYSNRIKRKQKVQRNKRKEKVPILQLSKIEVLDSHLNSIKSKGVIVSKMWNWSTRSWKQNVISFTDWLIYRLIHHLFDWLTWIGRSAGCGCGNGWLGGKLVGCGRLVVWFLVICINGRASDFVLAAERPRNMLRVFQGQICWGKFYCRRREVQIKLAMSPSHSILTPSQPVLTMTQTTPLLRRGSHWKYQLLSLGRPDGEKRGAVPNLSLWRLPHHWQCCWLVA